MSDWDEAAEDSTVGRGYKTAAEAWAHVAGARWQREALLDGEAVERVADILEALDGDDYLTVARAALAAATGEDEEDE